MKKYLTVLLTFLLLNFMIKNQVYGSWKSPISTDLIVNDLVKFTYLAKDNKDVYLSESRPQEKGRATILKLEGSTFKEIIPKDFNVRTAVHEYGGLSFSVFDKEIFFSNYIDQRIYKMDSSKKISAITPIATDRYANYIVDKSRDLIYCIQEEHLENEVNNAIVKIQKDGKVIKIASGNDFYASLALSLDHKKLAYLSWNKPDMPWDSATLYVADITKDGDLVNITHVAGSENISVFQPRWGVDGYLYFISDQSNFWNLYRYKDGEIESLLPMDAEFGLPMWVVGQSTYDFFIDNKKLYLVASYTKNAVFHLLLIDPVKKTSKELKTPFTSVSSILVVDDNLYFIGASFSELPSVVLLNLKTLSYKILKKSKDLKLDSGYISIPQIIEFSSVDNQTAHMNFYPPKNKDYQGLKNEKPPLIVRSHGGPTGQCENFLNLEIQFWTSRGFALADVNYSGSSGYGREYRQRLNGRWGILDVDDCVNAAKYLIKQKLVDPNRMIIRGGSAGGYTTLCALTFRDFFKAGSSYYGVSDAEALALETHKFEAKYLDKLIGPYPEKKEIYFERSPINFIKKLSSPIIFFQGDKDLIVPQSQSQKMFEILKDKKIPTAYLLFENEGHGFRTASVIKKCLESELYFYSKIFSFEILDDIEPIEIFNLK